MKVQLSDLIEAIEYENELLTHYYNKKTGVIIYLEDASTASYTYKDMERIEEFEEWEQDLKSLKEEIEHQGLINEWYEFRENSEYNIAINWCKRNNIAYS